MYTLQEWTSITGHYLQICCGDYLIITEKSPYVSIVLIVFLRVELVVLVEVVEIAVKVVIIRVLVVILVE
jgi:hypothetical protein